MAVGPVEYDLSFWGEYLDAQQLSLPALPHVTQLSDRVIRILGGNPGRFTLQGTNTYIVGTGKSRMLVDTGQGKPEWIESVSEILDSQSIDISHVLLTHWHGDHVGGVRDLVRHGYSQLHRDIYKCDPDDGQSEIRDGQVFTVEGATLEAVHLPGHSSDHMCFILREEGACFLGDNVLGHGSSTSEDLSAYIHSLRRTLLLPCHIGYPGHGNHILDLKAKIRQYLQFQQAREQQICKALSGVDATQDELAIALFKTRPSNMRRSVIEPVLSANLWALAAEGRVGFRVRNQKRRWYLRAQSRTIEDSEESG